jgi:hypothetical protein
MAWKISLAAECLVTGARNWEDLADMDCSARIEVFSATHNTLSPSSSMLTVSQNCGRNARGSRLDRQISCRPTCCL